MDINSQIKNETHAALEEAGRKRSYLRIVAFVEAVLMDYAEAWPFEYGDPSGLVALARAANWAAKFTGDFSHKVNAFALAASHPDIIAGWKDGVFYVECPLGGQASAHDPLGCLYYALDDDSNTAIYPGEWDGRNLQPFAIEIAKGFYKRKRRCAMRARQYSNLNAFQISDIAKRPLAS